MKSFFQSLFFYLVALQIGLAQQQPQFQFVSPKPNSIMVSNETNIILSVDTKLQESSIIQNLITVVGSLSGVHKGEFLLTDDNQTIVFNPSRPFAYDEVVTVSVIEGIKTLTNYTVPEYSFSFKTETEGITQLYEGVFDEDFTKLQDFSNNSSRDRTLAATLPAPPITIDSLNNPSPGYIFMATWDRNVPQQYGNFIFILDSVGHILDSIRVNGAPFDFQIQPNGLLSYALGDFASNVPNYPEEELQHVVLDSNLAVVDSFKMKNGYDADFHEFLMLPNGHVMMMTYHTIIFDMSTIVPGGQTNCSLVINVIQEQDAERNVVFEWRNLDYIPITDSDDDLTASRVNYSTLNGFDVDTDGNILASFRSHSEIMKISRATGEIIWRMGSPRGEFTFVGEHEENAPYYHARQHNIRRLPNGNITLFDNGEFHQPKYSRGVEYNLDEVNKVATLVSEVRYPIGNIFTTTAGNAQKLSNGGWFIGYGVPSPQFVRRNAVEYHADGSIALALSLPGGILAYRVQKFPWKELVKKPSVTIAEILEGNTYVFNEGTVITGVTIKYLNLSAVLYNLVTVTRLPYGPVQAEFSEDVPIVYPVSILYEGDGVFSQTSEIRIDLAEYPEIKHPGKTALFIRENPNQGLFKILPTTYDSVSNKLVAIDTSFGEIVFGETDNVYSAKTPILYEPTNNKKVLPQDSIAIRWNGKGVYDLFQLQISTDSVFNNLIVDLTMNPSFFFMKNLLNHSVYYWRVRSILNSGFSNWSPIWNFQVTDAFINVSTPNGGEIWSMGAENVIRWETNITDSVKLDLLYENQIIANIVGSIFGYPSAYRWLIPTNLTADTSYKIRIVSIIDSSIIDTSDVSFSIVPPNGVEIINSEIPEQYNLYQNYPNPFNPSTKIRYSLPYAGNVVLNIYNSIGENITTLVSSYQQPGNYEVDWNADQLASGIYFCSFKVISSDGEHNYNSVKKMILLR